MGIENEDQAFLTQKIQNTNILKLLKNFLVHLERFSLNQLQDLEIFLDIKAI